MPRVRQSCYQNFYWALTYRRWCLFCYVFLILSVRHRPSHQRKKNADRERKWTTAVSRSARRRSLFAPNRSRIFSPLDNTHNIHGRKADNNKGNGPGVVSSENWALSSGWRDCTLELNFVLSSLSWTKLDHPTPINPNCFFSLTV